MFFGIVTLLVLLLSPAAYAAISRGRIGISESELAGGQAQLLGNCEDSEPKSTSGFERESVGEQEQLLGAAVTVSVAPAASGTREPVAKAGRASGGGEAERPGGVGCCSWLELEGMRAWGPRVAPVVLLFSVIQACTWLVLRSVIGRRLCSCGLSLRSAAVGF